MRGLFVAFLAAAVLLGQSASGQAQTLEEELSLLLGDHPLIVAGKKDLEGADAGVDAAFADYLPDLAARADTGYEHTNSPARRDGALGDFNAHRGQATLTLTEKLFDGFEREANLEIAEIDRSIAETSLDGTVQDLLLAGARTYHDLLRQSRLVELGRQNEERIKAQLQLEDERVKRGSGIEVDVLFAKTRLQIAKERRVGFQGALRDAVARYVQVFGRPPDRNSMTEPIAPASILPPDLETALAIAMDENPDVREGQQRVESAGEERAVAGSDFYPTVEVLARGNVEEDVDGTSGFRNDFAVLVQLTWEIFSGFETKAQVAEASANYSASMSRLAFINREVAERTRIAFNALETARERVELLQNAVNIATEVFAARQRLREAGRESAIDVLDAETELIDAQIDFTNASYDARIAVYRVLAATGQLTPSALGITPKTAE